jgi:ABC-type transporter Mla maintaining outer membrane lipid asymmetry ATPase subunit MlaF
VIRPDSDPSTVLDISGVSKQYGALRPLRIDSLTLRAGEHAALVGLDQPAAEIFINLVTGATLPDTGTIHVFGRSTADIADGADWLTALDRFGIVSERAVLLESLSVVQNLAMPFSLEIEPPPDEVRGKAVALAREVGLGEAVWDAPVSALRPPDTVRVRLGRALAFDPSVVLLEHPSARVPPDAAAALGATLGAVLRGRAVTAILITMDQTLVEGTGMRTLVLDPATGRLSEARRGRRLSRIAFWK